MTTRLSTTTRRTRTVSTGRASDVHAARRPFVVPGALLAAALLLLAGCNSGTPNASGPTAPAAVSASAADAFDNVGSAQGDEAGVAAVVAAWDAAWNAGDGNAIGALFIPDADFVNGRAQVAHGAATIAANHVTNLNGVFKGSHTTGTIRRVVFLSGTVAVLDVDQILTGFRALPPGVVATAPGMLSNRHKRIVVKRAGTWRIQSAQLTPIPPTPPAP
jgi:uncharacterized protein (TIGR02246 family)